MRQGESFIFKIAPWAWRLHMWPTSMPASFSTTNLWLFWVTQVSTKPQRIENWSPLGKNKKRYHYFSLPVQRGVYKDLVLILQKDNYLSKSQLKTKVDINHGGFSMIVVFSGQCTWAYSNMEIYSYGLCRPNSWNSLGRVTKMVLTFSNQKIREMRRRVGAIWCQSSLLIIGCKERRKQSKEVCFQIYSRANLIMWDSPFSKRIFLTC